MKNKILIFILFLISVSGVVGQDGKTSKSTSKKQKKSGIDFDLLMGTHERDMMQAATHDTEYISIFYKSGPYLIYDCMKGNYACVHKDGFKFCRSLRKESLDKKSKVLSCAPLKKFDRFEYCIEKQKELVDYPIKKYFCLSSRALQETMQKNKLLDDL